MPIDFNYRYAPNTGSTSLESDRIMRALKNYTWAHEGLRRSSGLTGLRHWLAAVFYLIGECFKAIFGMSDLLLATRAYANRMRLYSRCPAYDPIGLSNVILRGLLARSPDYNYLSTCVGTYLQIPYCLPGALVQAYPNLVVDPQQYAIVGQTRPPHGPTTASIPTSTPRPIPAARYPTPAPDSAAPAPVREGLIHPDLTHYLAGREPTLPLLLTYWHQKAERGPTARLLERLALTESQTIDMMNYLRVLTKAADFVKETSRRLMAEQVLDILEAVTTNESFKETVLNNIHEAMSTCGDRVAFHHNNIVCAYLLRNARTPQANVRIIIGLHRLTLVTAIAKEKAAAVGPHADEIEYIFFYQDCLKERLELPSNTRRLYGAQVTREELDDAAREVISKTATFEQKKKILLESADWKAFLEKSEDYAVSISAIHADYDLAVATIEKINNGEDPGKSYGSEDEYTRAHQEARQERDSRLTIAYEAVTIGYLTPP